MPRGPSKGRFKGPSNIIALPQAQQNRPDSAISVTSTNGHAVIDVSDIDFGSFRSTPLIFDNISNIRRKLIKNTTPEGLRSVKRYLLTIQQYLLWYQNTFGSCPTEASGIDGRFTHQFISWQIQQQTLESTKASRFRSFKRFLAAINVEPTLFPPNPFRNGDSDDKVIDTITYDQARQILNRAKSEISVIRRRASEAHRLAGRGKDPRRKFGGEIGAWSKPENRAWVLKRLLKREIHTFDQLRFTMNHRNLLAGFEAREGAEIVGSSGEVLRLTGWNGHLRWFFPWADDLAPFIALLMLRTGWNLSVIAAIQSRRWLSPYPYKVGSATDETHVFVISQKVRGRKDDLAQAKVERIASSRRPSSHPYRILKFLEYLTVGLRKEVWRKRNELLSKRERTAKEDADLAHLDAIKGDLFLYKSEQGISSFRLSTGSGRELPAFLKRAGVNAEARQLRDGAILFSYQASGHNLFVAQIVGNHADRETTALYLRRRATLDRIWQDATRVFDASLKLIEKGEFDVKALRRVLANQGLTDQQVSNLLDPANTTRWGNRCADPLKPPPGFDRNANGEACRTQDCIDGCPYARWFSDSIDHVARQMSQAERRLALLGMESTDGSSLQSRIARCQILLARWSPDERDAALAKARANADAPDLFFGAAL